MSATYELARELKAIEAKQTSFEHDLSFHLEAAESLVAAGYTKPRTIETVEELGALPVGSVVLAHWPDNSQPDYQMTRCPEGAASAGGGFGLAGGSHWLDMANWGATLTVIWEPAA